MAEWIYDRPHHWYCSDCKAMWTDTAKNMFLFCPSCGAKMENTDSINKPEFAYKDIVQDEYRLSCPFCKYEWEMKKPFSTFCPNCGKDVTNKATILSVPASAIEVGDAE